ncbi:MAG: zinc ribbon domain-containing protein [Desulfobacterales bacterium]|nr:zinc ribbon domain-containing protein [Desulfobacterales bacterium]
MSFLWHLNNNLKIADTKLDVAEVRSKADKAGRRAAASMESVERLTLVLRAMWELLSENTTLTEADLEARVKSIDLRDGRLDAKYRPEMKPFVCRSCGNMVHPSRTHCQFCGAEIVDGADPFNKVQAP